MSKAYGLIIPGKQKETILLPTSASRPSIFDENTSDSSDEDLPKVRGKKNAPNIEPGALERRQARTIQQKALTEDPTIFQYDEVYDEIETKRKEERKMKSSEEKKPKYIGRLLQQAERRKLENERRIERQVQKEREAEGEMFKDKESFVTSAYKQKLEELKKAEEAEKREEYLESIGDVTKQGNLDGFYRHLFEQKLGPKENIEKKNNDTNEIDEDFTKIKSDTKIRTYRKRQSSNDEDNESEENFTSKKAHIQSNLDADSDFSIDDSSSEEEPETHHKASLNAVKDEFILENSDIKTENTQENICKIKEEIDEKPKTENETCEEKDLDSNTEESSLLTQKINIWEKRTVGDIFDAALQRYFERKSLKTG